MQYSEKHIMVVKHTHLNIGYFDVEHRGSRKKRLALGSFATLM